MYHEAHFNSKLSAKKVLPELIIQVDESILDPCGFQIQQRKWERFTKPIQAVGHLMVKEFYANAWEPDKEKRKPYTYTSMVRGKDISFPQATSKEGSLRYRSSLGSSQTTTNRSELTIERVVLIHSIIIGENINVEEIIADQIYKFVYKTDVSSSLPFPSIIAALCADAKIPAILDDTLISQEPPIIGVAMTRTRETRARNPRQARQATPP
ncbi:hypothetical protein PIB30_093738 [Stylosanthes scabra]|uniref:Putative plant transposon protein domain-containing protein n=1 Tax=Stylosanthes scabra TaxID=79078 RepID=A0ABU6SVQ3_9FABA|nr:hypothetical protein [Stylosanthes scabra]